MKIDKSLVLTTLGCFGVGATALLAIHNTEKFDDMRDEGTPSKLDTLKCYIPTILAGTATCGCIIGSHVVSAKQLAAATTAVGVMGAKYRELSEMLKKKHPDIYKEMKDDIDKRNLENEIKKKSVVKHNDGKELYFESFSEQLFWATENEVLQAECALNESMFNIGEYTLYEYLANFNGIELKNWMQFIGWYEGDTSYSYNAGYLGSYVKPVIEKQAIEVDGHSFEANTISWPICPDYDPECDQVEMDCLESAIETGTDV